MDHVLSVSTSSDGNVVFIHADKPGLDFLIEKLSRLRNHIQNDESEHEHFMTPAWAGNELSERKMDQNERQVHHIKFYAWTDTAIDKHDLRDTNTAEQDAAANP